MPDIPTNALYPDMGVVAMLRNEWSDRTFEISALSDRNPVRLPSPVSAAPATTEVGSSSSAPGTGDGLVMMAAPDPTCLEDVMRVTREVPVDVPLIMFNPRLASGDVGVGLNIRRVRNEFLAPFQVVYSICPIGDIGSVFRCFPSPWIVFVEDETTPGRYGTPPTTHYPTSGIWDLTLTRTRTRTRTLRRANPEPYDVRTSNPSRNARTLTHSLTLLHNFPRYIKAAERDSRPAGEELDNIINTALGVEPEEGEGDNGAGNLLGGVAKAMREMNRFMKQLSQ